MDLSEVGAEFGSCCHLARAILIGILQNRQEVQFSRKDRLASDGDKGHKAALCLVSPLSGAEN